MIIKPITIRKANAFVVKFHRHHKEVQGAKFAIGLFVNDVLVGVAICGRPVSRRLDDGEILEATRVCVIEDLKNACSKLYGACARIAKEMGYKKIISYILENETGTSLRASGWQIEKNGAGDLSWNRPARKRNDTVKNLFGETRKYPETLKTRYSKLLINGK